MANARFYSSIAPATTLTSGVNAVATTISVVSTAGLPGTTPYTLSLDYGVAGEELVDVTAVAGLNLTVTRGVDGTSAASHNTGATVRHVTSARDFTESRTHEASASAVHGVTGALVGLTDTQTLTNKTLTSPTINSGTLTGTFAGAHTYSGAVTQSGGGTMTGTFAGNPTFSGTPVFGAMTINGTIGGTSNFSSAIQSFRTNATDASYSANHGSAAFDQFRILMNGKHEWGPGTASRDTFLYRNGVNTLKTDGILQAAGQIQAGAGVDVVGDLSVSNDATISGDLTVTGIGGMLFKSKATGTTINNDGTNSSDPDLTFTVLPNSVYTIECCLFVSGGSAADFQAAWSVPAGASGTWSLYGPSLSIAASSTTGEIRFNAGSLTTTRVAGVSDTATPVLMPASGLLRTGGSGGTFVLQWAQNVATAVNTTLEADSWVKLIRVG